MLLFCDNETNAVELFGAAKNASKYPKDGVNRFVVDGDGSGINPFDEGTKVAVQYVFDAVPAGQSVTVRLRLSPAVPSAETFGPDFDAVLADRHREADEFYAQVIDPTMPEADRHVARRAYAGLLWTKQLYRYNVEQWLETDPQPAPIPGARTHPIPRNSNWRHLYLADVISMPDEWEYPWFAAWDLAFHAIPLAHVDPDFAKEQLLLMCREWAMHPNGQLPAYEWGFGDVNPPVHAWAAWHVYRIDGYRDRSFLIRVFTKLLLNFSWWVNRKDANGSNVFEGGFLGMDNIALFDRSAPLPPGFRLEQSDATSWMAFYCQQMFKIALELARTEKAWDDVATKFFEHFLAIAKAMNSFGSHGTSLWDEEDGFFYDILVAPDGTAQPLRVRSMVGLLPILAATEVPAWVGEECPDLTARMHWLQRRRPELVRPLLFAKGAGERKILLSLVDQTRLRRLLERVFDTEEFLSPYGIRSLSAACRQPITTHVAGRDASIEYEPGESRTSLFGGNSNWRGPDLVPGERAAGRQAAHHRAALRRHVHHRDPDRFGQRLHPGRRRRRDRRWAHSAVPAGPRTTTRRRRADRGDRRPAVGRAPDLQRVLRRRHRRGSGGHAPDRLDGPGGPPAQPPAAPRPPPAGLGLTWPRPLPSARLSPAAS